MADLTPPVLQEQGLEPEQTTSPFVQTESVPMTDPVPAAAPTPAPPEPTAPPSPMAPQAPVIPTVEEILTQTADETDAQRNISDAKQTDKEARQAANKARLKELLSEDRGKFGRKLSVKEALDVIESENSRSENIKANTADDLQQRVMAKEASDQREMAAFGEVITKDPEIDAIIADKEKKNALFQDSTEIKEDLGATPSDEEVEMEAEPVRKMAAKEQGIQRAAAEERTRANDIFNKRMAEIKAMDDGFRKEVDEGKFYRDKHTSRRSGIGLFLATAAAIKTGGRNFAQEAIEKDIDRDIAAQKLNRTEALAKKRFALNMLQTELDHMKFKSNDAERNVRIDKMKMDMAIKTREVTKELMTRDAIAAGKLRREDANLLGKEDRERIVNMEDGTIQLASNKFQADQIFKFKGEIGPALSSAKKVRHMIDNFSKINPKDRGVASSEMQKLIGQLRVPFTGPGVLTLSERDILANALGNPNKILTLPSFERAKIDNLISGLEEQLEMKLIDGGIVPTKSPRQKRIDEFTKKIRKTRPNITRNQVEKILDKGGR